MCTHTHTHTHTCAHTHTHTIPMTSTTFTGLVTTTVPVPKRSMWWWVVNGTHVYTTFTTILVILLYPRHSSPWYNGSVWHKSGLLLLLFSNLFRIVSNFNMMKTLTLFNFSACWVILVFEP